MATLPVPARRAPAALSPARRRIRSGRYASFTAVLLTCSIVSPLAPPNPFRTRETVAIETPDALATSPIESRDAFALPVFFISRLISIKRLFSHQQYFNFIAFISPPYTSGGNFILIRNRVDPSYYT
jgi:hypothetical protein